MCHIEIREDFHSEVIEWWDDEENRVLESSTVQFTSGQRLEAAVYDADDEAACLQFPDGSVIVGVPTSSFRVLSQCGECDDPHNPDLSRIGELGPMPRWSADRWAVEALLTEQTLWPGGRPEG